MFGNRNCSAENRKKTISVFGRISEKRPNNLYRTMTLRDQIDACTNAANTSATWKHLKLSERETQKSLQARNTDSERLLSAASHVSDENRWEKEGVVVAGYCDDWNREMDKQINYRMLCFLKHTRMACIQTALHELAAPGFKVRGNSVLKHLASFEHEHHLLIFIIFLKACDNVIRVTNIFPNS